MKIIIKTSGGFAYMPGINQPMSIDTANLDPAAANELEGLVTESRFYEQPSKTDGLLKGAADYMKYNITVEDGTSTHTIETDDITMDSTLRKLVTQVRNIARSSQS